MSFQIPIALIVFNRPDLVKALLMSISPLKPSRVYVIADGPRSVNGDDARTERVRSLIDEGIDWPCEVNKIYRKENFGCGRSLAEGVSEVFLCEERLIILEEDCLADQSFFHFCQELLNRYADDERIMTISGSRFFQADGLLSYSYHFSKFQHIWGWATWKRAWKKMDYSMQRYANLVNTDWLGEYLKSRIAGAYWRRNYQTILDGRSDVWDYQWQLACWANEGLCIQPEVNLVENVGVATGGTHSSEETHHQSLSKMKISWPLRHPPNTLMEEGMDAKIRDHFFSEGRLKDFVKYILKG